jgi:hypothetical protein
MTGSTGALSRNDPPPDSAAEEEPPRVRPPFGDLGLRDFRVPEGTDEPKRNARPRLLEIDFLVALGLVLVFLSIRSIGTNGSQTFSAFASLMKRQKTSCS